MSDKPSVEDLRNQSAAIVPYRVGDGQAVLQKRAAVFKALMQEHGYPLVAPTTKTNRPGFKHNYQHPKTDSR